MRSIFALPLAGIDYPVVDSSNGPPDNAARHIP